jgi:hypothetical protein
VVLVVNLPDAEDGTKQGVDDFLVAGGTVDDLMARAAEYSEFAFPADEWPVLAEEAYHGLAGEVVHAIGPNTESDPVAILMEFLSRFGNLIGRGAYFEVEGDTHYLKINHVSVGETSKGRKGTAQGRVNRLMERVDPDWLYDCIETGLSSGEGLVNRVRDPVKKEKDGDLVVVDPGVKDKRLLVEEPEFASPLTNMAREGNTLSMTLRNAWDDKTLRTLTKNSDLKSTRPHITIVGHVTRSELLKHLTESKLGGGIANRFLFLLVRRSKCLPFGGKRDVFGEDFIERLKTAAEFGRQARSIPFSGELEEEHGYGADELWIDIYADLSEGKPFLLGAVISRAEAYVRRLATLYAVLDRSETVRVPHLLAALAIWQYAEDSATILFGRRTGDKQADEVLGALREAGEQGLTKSELYEVLNWNVKALRLSTILKDLEQAGWAYSKKDEPQGKGRPPERWFADGS